MVYSLTTLGDKTLLLILIAFELTSQETHFGSSLSSPRGSGSCSDTFVEWTAMD